MKRALLVAVTIGLATNVEAADLDPFYLGVFGGAGSATTSNTLIQGGQIVGEFPTIGTTLATYAGFIAGYNQRRDWVYWGAEASVGYDFNHACFSIDCAVERHTGPMLQQVGQLGIAWHDLVLAGRFGAAERTNNLSVFDDIALRRDYGSGWMLGTDFGAMLKFRVDQHIDIRFSWDHIGWSKYSASTPAYPSFQNSASINHEELFKVAITFH